MDTIVVLDSSIINKDPSCGGRNMKLLAEWASLKLLSWHIPWVVYREVITKALDERKKNFDELKKSLNNLMRQGQKEDTKKQLESVGNILEDLKNSSSKNNQEYWDDFFKFAVVDDFECDLSRNVMESYFDGNPPFSAIKCRKDIPDAFIFEYLKKKSKDSKIFFICGDINLRDKSSKIENVTCYESLNEFEKTDFVKQINFCYNIAKDFRSKVDFVLRHKEEILKEAESYVEGKLYDRLYEGISNENIPSDDNEGRVTVIPRIDSIILEESQITCVNDIIYVPIYVKCEFEVEYYINKSELCLYENRCITMGVRDITKYYHVVYEIFNAELNFSFSIKKCNNETDFDLQSPENVDDLVLNPIYKIPEWRNPYNTPNGEFKGEVS